MVDFTTWDRKTLEDCATDMLNRLLETERSTAHPQGFGRQVTFAKVVFNHFTKENEWQRVQGWLRDYRVSKNTFYAVVEGNDGTLNLIDATEIQFVD